MSSDQGDGRAVRFGEAPRRGRPRAFGEAELEVLKRIVRENPLASREELLDLVERETGIRVGRQTFWRRLKELGFKRVVSPRGASAEATEKADAGEGPASRPTYRYTDKHRMKSEDALYQHGLSDAEWELVADIFEDKVRGKPRKYSRRSMLDAMSYVVRGGIPWRMLPNEFPPWHRVYKTFQRWAQQGRFEKMHDRLRGMWREREGRSPEPTAAALDSQSVKTSAQGGTKGYDAGKKVKGRKRHILTDTLGLILAVLVTSAGVQDRDAAAALLDAGISKYHTLERVYVDSAYAGRCQLSLQAKYPQLTVTVVRHPANRSVGRLVEAQQELPLLPAGPRTFVPLPKRWVVERTNAWNCRPRRLAVDQERRLSSSTAWLYFVEARRLSRRLTSDTTA